MEKPGRKYEVGIQIGADDWETILYRLDELVNKIKYYGQYCEHTCIQYNCYSIVDIVVDELMMEEEFQKQMKEYLAGSHND